MNITEKLKKIKKYISKIFIVVCILSMGLFASCEDAFDDDDSEPTPPPPVLVYCYGGVNGQNAVEDPNTQITALTVNRRGLGYQWSNGSLSNWGLSYKDAGALACAFYLGDDGRWYGGKFDWISTSRTTRSFTNIDSGYHGWEPSKFYNAKKRGFLILSKDGKKRTNFITE